MDRLPSIMLGGAISKGPEASGRNGRAVPGGIVTHDYHPPAAVGTRSGRVGPSATAGSSVRMIDSGHVKTVGGTWSLSSGNESGDPCSISGLRDRSLCGQGVLIVLGLRMSHPFGASGSTSVEAQPLTWVVR